MRILITGASVAGRFVAAGLQSKYRNQNGIEIIDFTESDETDNLLSVASNPLPADVIFFCYDYTHLEAGLMEYNKVISASTIIVSLLLDIQAKTRIENVFPHAQVVTGFYVLQAFNEYSPIKKPVTKKKILLSNDIEASSKGKRIVKFLKDTGLPIELHPAVEDGIWRHYLLYSSLFTIVSSLQISVAEVLGHSNRKTLLVMLLQELTEIGGVLGYPQPANVIELTLKEIQSLPVAVTDQLTYSFLNATESDKRIWTLNIINLGRRVNAQTCYYEKTFLGQLQFHVTEVGI